MADPHPYQKLSPTTLADLLTRDRVMDYGIRPLWEGVPRIAGPAFTVRCDPGDNLMLHAAIYRAPAGSVIVVESSDSNFAVAGGNVCAVAQKRGILGFVVDGVIRDLAEVRANRFPVFARGVIPIPGAKGLLLPLNQPIRCGGVSVAPGDLVVADEEGIVVIPSARVPEVLMSASSKSAQDAAETLGQWEIRHRKKIEEILTQKGFKG